MSSGPVPRAHIHTAKVIEETDETVTFQVNKEQDIPFDDVDDLDQLVTVVFCRIVDSGNLLTCTPWEDPT